MKIKNMIMGGIILVAVLSFAFLFYSRTKTQQTIQNPQKQEIQKLKSSQPNQPRMVLYFNPNCPHCRSFIPEWMKFKEMTNLETEEVNCAVSDEKCATISGVPTVIIHVGDKKFEYVGRRTAESLVDFQNKTFQHIFRARRRNF